MFRIGVNFDIEYITAGIVNDENKIVKKEYVPTLKYRSFEAIVKDIADLCVKLCNDQKLDIKKDIEYVGIACVGAVNSEKGIMIHSNIFRNFENAEIVKEFKKYIDIEVLVEKNANCYALAESRIGATKGYKNSVVIALGKTITGGIVLDGKIYHGSFYGAGEFGHHVIIHDGEECICGRRGCWSAYASSDAVTREGRIMAIKHPDSIMFKMVSGDVRLLGVSLIYSASKQGDKYAQSVINDYAKYVALGMVNIINILQPDVVAIGGRMMDEGDTYIDYVRQIVREKVFGQEAECNRTKIVYADMDYDGIIIGAAMLKD